MLRATPIVAMIASLSVSVAANAKTIEPKAGEYLSSVSTTASTCVGSSLGLESAGLMFWPGPAAAGFTLRVPISASAPLGQNGALSVGTGPITPAAGVRAWSGVLTGFMYPGKSPFSLSFTATLIYATNDAFQIAFQFPQSCQDGSMGTRTHVFTNMLI